VRPLCRKLCERKSRRLIARRAPYHDRLSVTGTIDPPFSLVKSQANSCVNPPLAVPARLE
jgi:hypothetical protein